MPSKKIILFIVEGITDKTCLAFALSKLLNNSKVEFAVTSGDITSRSGSSINNIAAKVGDIVKNFATNIFRASDFLEVVHLVDMDGAYIPDMNILEKTNEIPQNLEKPQKPYYADDHIFTENIDAIIGRNHQKAEILDKLISLNKVWRTIPYSVYYFSCNLDHIMHDERNLLDKEKYQNAVVFDKKYGEDPQAFLTFLHNAAFAVPGKYGETWTFIKADNNSLKRYSNFHLYFSNPKNSRKTYIDEAVATAECDIEEGRALNAKEALKDLKNKCVISE